MAKKNAKPSASPTPPKAKAAKVSSAGPTHKMIAENRKARHRFEILETVECGLVLKGSEVKSLRDSKCSLDEAYGRVQQGDLWLIGCDIPIYKPACYWNHEPTRPRKMLLHRREMLRLSGKASEKGLTLVPLKMYFNERGQAKCVIGLCKGLKLHDKREVMKKNDAQREIQRAMRRK
ncbi:MAG: SsrA-binding protein SmpB [Pirellulaceae bacterium]|nr:SsrA-binding protein SmpB [Pirellulaceae bacterium]